ncbi:Multidrug resistance protein MdtE [BD1-7 clade bacterium]|uniref:Multidrug resistance protein MdtE n=1 Tax=BD1-7 clade bacterium TaxID=2029982 RepID=A0A5S9N5Y0_9GAMM|nr:Multidrug resistance protein MdtE [BD1-7 clade bacterium]
MRNLLSAIGILIFGLMLAVVIGTSKPAPEKVVEQPPEALPVQAFIAEGTAQPVVVTTHGIVEAEHRIDLVSEVAGVVTRIDRDFIKGGTITKGKVLLEVEPTNYQAALAQTKTNLAQALEEEASERAQAEQAKREWRDLGSKAANDLFLRKPQLARAEAKTAAARATLRQAERNLAQTRLTLNFDAAMISTDAHVGQYLAPGSKVASLYAKDDLMLELPLTQAQLEVLNIEWPISDSAVSPTINLSASIGGKVKSLNNEVRHSGSIIDDKNQLATLIIDISDKAALPGLYVNASITGAPRNDVIAINEGAFHDKRFVLIADADNRIQFRAARQLGRDGDKVLLAADIQPGDVIISDRIPLATPGMQVAPNIQPAK